MAYKNGILTSIVALGETLILAISLGLYTPKEAVKKIEDVVNEKLEIGENNKWYINLKIHDYEKDFIFVGHAANDVCLLF